MPPAVVTTFLTGAYANPLFTVPVVFGAVSTRGLFDHEAALVDDGMGGEVKREQRKVTVRTGSLPSTCKQGSTLTVDGAQYEVRAVLPFGDGLETHYVLAPVTP